MRERATRIALWLLAAAAVAVFADNASRPLANPDEGRYSEISREMVASGDWVTPRLNGIKYFEKPPLQYWASAVAFQVFGANEASARLYVGLCGPATLLLVGYTARRLWGGTQALAAMMVLAASPYFVALTGTVTLDMGLTLWLTLALCAFLIAESPATDARQRRAWLLAAWAGTALAVLSKGLIGMVLPAAVMFLYMAVRRDFAPLRRLEWLPGIGIFLAITVPWFVAVSMANPEFLRFFFVHEHFERFLTTSHGRVEPWWYFLPILAVGFLPWMFALPSALAHAWEREAGTRAFRPLLFVVLWAVFIVTFFSSSGSKLPTYIAPAFPALALILGRYLAEAPPTRLTWMLAPVAPLALALAWVAWNAPQRAKEEWTRVLHQGAMNFSLEAAAILFVTAVAGALAMGRERRLLAIVGVALGTMLVIERAAEAFGVFSPRQSGLAIAEKMRPWLGPGARVYSVGYYDQSVTFYIGRTVTLVEYRDEFGPGLSTEPAKAIATLEDFAADWQRPGEALAIMHQSLPEKLRAHGLPMQVLHEDPRRVLVRKP